MTRKITFILPLMISIILQADETAQGFYAKCEEGKKLILASYNLRNKTDAFYAGGHITYPSVNNLEEENIFFTREKKTISCKVYGYNIKISFQPRVGSASGMCGANPGGKVSLTIDGKQYMKNVNMNVGCYGALDVIEITDHSDFPIRFCGHNSNGRIAFEGCLSYSDDEFSKLPESLGIFPLNTMIENINREK